MDNDIEYLKYLIKEYENIIPSLNEQINYYQDAHSSLKKEVIAINQENKSLNQKLEEALNLQNQSSDVYKYSEINFIDNLKRQLNLSIKEKESISELWKTSLKRIDCLENELKLYSAGSVNNSKAVINKLRKLHESEIKTCHIELKKSRHKIEETIQTSEETLSKKSIEIEELNTKLNKSFDTIKGLEQDALMQQEKLSELQCEHLQSNQVVKQKEIVIEDLKAQIYNAKLKVAEACHITEAALIEKDAALHREKTTQEEMTKLTTTLSEIVQESQNKITNEINAVKNTYSDKIGKLETHLKKTKDDLEAKKLELRKFRKMESDLRVKLKQANTVDKTATIMKLEEAYSKLQISECKKQQLLEEVDSLKVTIEQVTRSNEIILNNKEMEKRMLEAKIRNVQNELEVSHLKLGQFGIKVEELNEKVKSIDVHMHHEYELKQSQSDRLLTEKLSEIEANNAKTNKELMEQLQSQIDLNHKWKREVKDVTEKMEKRMEELRKEILNVKKSKRKLEAQLSEAEKKCNEYKGHLFKLCNEFNDIAEEAK